MRAVAIGDIAHRAAALAVGGEADFDGFLSAQRNGRGVVFHLAALDAAPHAATTQSTPSN